MRLHPTIVARIVESPFYQNLVVNKKLSIDSSFFQDWDLCEVQGLLGTVLKLVAAREESALVYGSAFHAALDAHYSALPFKRRSSDELVAIALGVWNSAKILGDQKRNASSLEKLIRTYLTNKLIVGDFNPLLDSEGKPIVEKGFEFNLGSVITELGDIQLFWKGKIDLVAKLGSELWVVDHKTTAIMGEKFADDKYRSNQMMGYTMLATQQLGLPVKGVIVNAAQTRTKKDSYEFDFATYSLPISEHAVYEWAEEIYLKLSRLITLLLSLKDSMPSNRYALNGVEPELPLVGVTRGACVTKYGKCRFFDVCQAFQTARPGMLFNSGMFKVSSFNPLD